MDANGDLNHKTDPHSQSHNGDESCVIIEEDVPTIQIDDTVTEDSILIDDEEISPLTTDADGKSFNETAGEANQSFGDYQVIDQVGDSEASGSQETINDPDQSITDKSIEFCAPNNVDLNVTPLPTQQPEGRLLIDIKFQNRKTYLAFQEEFVALVKNYYKSKIDDMDIHDDMSNNRIAVSERVVKKSEDFLVDKTPNMKDLEGPTPTYRKSFGKTVLTDEKESEKVQKTGASSSRNACFNCDKDSHSLRDCPEPRNMKKVNKARNEFSRKELRYHDDNENEYGNMVPGAISDDLRSALGLSSSQLPVHVYRMRLYGYPPAWIEEAKIHNSGLSLFVEKDKKQLQPGIDEGETEENNFQYDLQKIHEFPGFNVQPEHQYVDLYKILNTPPMLPQHSKDELIKSLDGGILNGYKKRKRRNSGAIVDITGDDSFTTDMDIEAESDEILPPGVSSCVGPPLPSDPSKPPEPMEDGELSNDSRSRSPDENQLTEQRKALIAEIAESSVFLDTSSINSSLNITAANSSAVSLNHSQLNATIIENSENENRDNCAKDTMTSFDNERSGHVDTTVLGCPVLPSFSPFNNLPDGEKFQEGVCDVINFENLAESTGKYEKMKLLINKVRVFQQHHQKE